MKNILLSVAFAFLTGVNYAQSISPPLNSDEGSIPTASLASEGLDSVIIGKLASEITNGVYPNVHSLLIASHGKLVYEGYWPGTDAAYGASQRVNFTKHNLHDLRSVTKSVVSALVGLALAQGKIKSIDQKVFEFFPDYASLDTGVKSTLTIKHLLTMTTGLAWDEDSPYSSGQNNETKMLRSKDMVRFVLEQPVIHTPGSIWNYSGGATQLLGVIIERATGKKLSVFAGEFLFDPLGIKKFEWGRNGSLPIASTRLRLRPRDMLKFGLLYFNKGKWKGKQVIPAKWINESFYPHINRDSAGGGYGYQFWTWTGKIGAKPVTVVSANGNGDQNIYFDLTHDLLIVSTAGNYDRDDVKKDFNAMLEDYIYPALLKGVILKK